MWGEQSIIYWYVTLFKKFPQNTAHVPLVTHTQKFRDLFFCLCLFRCYCYSFMVTITAIYFPSSSATEAASMTCINLKLARDGLTVAWKTNERCAAYYNWIFTSDRSERCLIIMNSMKQESNFYYYSTCSNASIVRLTRTCNGTCHGRHSIMSAYQYSAWG